MSHPFTPAPSSACSVSNAIPCSSALTSRLAALLVSTANLSAVAATARLVCTDADAATTVHAVLAGTRAGTYRLFVTTTAAGAAMGDDGIDVADSPRVLTIVPGLHEQSEGRDF